MAKIVQILHASPLVTPAAVCWTVGGVVDALVQAVHIRSVSALEFSYGIASGPLKKTKVIQFFLKIPQSLHLRAVANAFGAVGRISEAVLLAPRVHSDEAAISTSGNTDLISNDQREHVVRRRGAEVFVVEQERIVVLNERRRNGSGVRGDGNIRTIPESFRFSTTNRLGSVVAFSPHVSRVVGPLQHALGASHVGR